MRGKTARPIGRSRLGWSAKQSRRVALGGPAGDPARSDVLAFLGGIGLILAAWAALLGVRFLW